MSNHNGHDPKNPDRSSGTNEEQDQVKVLSPDERDTFKGITIDAGDSGKRDRDNGNYYEYEYRDPQRRVYIRRFNLNSLIGFLNLLAVGLLVVGLIIFFFPLFLYLGIPLFIIFFLNSLLRRR